VTRLPLRREARISLALLGAMVAGVVVFLSAAFLMARSARASDDTLTLFVTGDTRGYLEPCGCRRDQAGGLPGRLTLVKQNAKGERLLVDVGNLTTGGRSYELLKLHYLLDGMNRMGYDAVNLGRREAGLDRDTLKKVIAESRAPFVSCNVLDRSTDAPLVEPFRVKSVAGVRIGITGVAEAEDDEIGPGIRIRPAAEALAEVLPQLKGRCDFIVVLAYVSQDSLKGLADRFHEINCLLGGDVAQSSQKAETINRAIAFNVTDQGKVLGQLTFKRGSAGLSLLDSVAIKVKDTIAPDPEMTAIIKTFKENLRERNIEFANEEGLDPIARTLTTADLYVGQDACGSCHPKAHKVNFESGHTHAYETLVAKGSEYDPDCLRCHNVGYGARDGFINIQRTPKLAGVQCENCHGRAGEHVKTMQAGLKKRSTFRPVTPNTCVKCHDEENSENFVYAPYWAKIKHDAK
jgi:hypothetical protein